MLFKLLAISFAIVVLGCGASASQSRPRTATTSQVVLSRAGEIKFDRPQKPRPVKAGQLPLVYMIEQPSKVRIADATTNQPLGESAAMKGSFVSIDEIGGVRIGGAILSAGPLAANHVYEIYVAPLDEQNTYRTERSTLGR